MPSVIRLSSSWQISQIIGVGICDEIILDLIKLILIIIILIFVFVDLGFNIEEYIALLTSTLSAMPLQSCQCCRASELTDKASNNSISANKEIKHSL